MPTPDHWDTRCGFCGPGTPVPTPECADCGGTGYLVLYPVIEQLLRFLERHLPQRFVAVHPLLPGARVLVVRDFSTPVGGRAGTIESVLRRENDGYVCSVLVDGEPEPAEIHSAWLRPLSPLAAAS